MLASALIRQSLVGALHAATSEPDGNSLGYMIKKES